MSRLFQTVLFVVLFPILLVAETRPDLTAQEVIDRYLEAMGGRAALHNVISTRMDCIIEYTDGRRSAVAVLKRKPDFVRIVIEDPRRRTIMAYNGEVAWIGDETRQQSVYREMPPDFAASFVREAPLEDALISSDRSGATIERLNDVNYLNRKFYQLKASFANGESSIFYIHPGIFYVNRIIKLDAEGNVLAEMVPSDFEFFEGVLFAKKLVRIQDGEFHSTLYVRDVDLNIGVLKKAFDPPEKLELYSETNAVTQEE